MTVQTINVSENQYVNSSAPTTAVGTGAGTNQEHSRDVLESLYKFVMPAAPAGEVLVSAVLSVRTVTTTGGSVGTHKIFLATPSTWAEATVTWNTRPTNGTQVGSIPANTLADTAYQFTLTTASIAALAGTTFTLACIGDTGVTDAFTVWGLRHTVVAYRPQLILTYAPSSYGVDWSATGTLTWARTTVLTTKFSFVDPTVADVLSSDVPSASSITSGSASSYAAGTFTTVNYPDTKIRARGGSLVLGTGTPGSTLYAPNTRYNYTWNAPPMFSIVFGLTGTEFELQAHLANSTYGCIRMKVDGKRVTDLPEFITGVAAGSLFRYKKTFATSKSRIITLEFGYVTLKGLYVSTGNTIFQPPALVNRCVFFGDSITGSSSATTGLGNGTWILHVADEVGVGDPYQAGIGGTGYSNAGSGAKAIDRINDVINVAPDSCIIWFGYNDQAMTTAAMTTAAELVISTIKAALPSCEIFLVGFWKPIVGASTTFNNFDAALKLAAQNQGVPFVSPITGNCYNGAGTLLGTVGTWSPLNTAEFSGAGTRLIDTDGVHPTDLGNIRIAHKIAPALQLMAGVPAPYQATFNAVGSLSWDWVSIPTPTVTINGTVNPGDTVTINATSSVVVTAWEIEQLSGTAVTLSGGDGTWFYTALSGTIAATGGTQTFRVRSFVDPSFSNWVTVSVVVKPQKLWIKQGASLLALRFRGAVTPGPVDPSPGLAIALTPRPVGDTKLALAHYFPQYAIMYANVDPEATGTGGDYYTNNYVNPAGESGAHVAYGGYLRDRPIPRDPLTTGSFLVENAREEIRQAKLIGLDGFFMDLTNTGGDNLTRCWQIRDTASAENPGFYVIPMLDLSTTSALSTASTPSIAILIASFAGRASTKYLADGRMLIGSFQADSKTVAFWTGLMSELSTVHGINIAVVGCFNSYATATETLKSVLWASGQWGFSPDPVAQNGHSDDAAYIRARIGADGGNLKHLYDIEAEDVRPYFSAYHESLNTGGLRASMARAIAANSDLLQLKTWNDYREGTHFNNSEGHGLLYAKLFSYYLEWWRTGSEPTVRRDQVFLTHRQSPLTAIPTGPQTSVMQQWIPPKAGGISPASTPRDQVEVVALLTAPGEVRITSGGTTSTFAVGAGLSVSLKANGIGPVKVEVWRNTVKAVDLTSPIEVSNTWPNDQRRYVGAESLATTQPGYRQQKASWPRTITAPVDNSYLPWNMPTPAVMGASVNLWGSHPVDTFQVSVNNPADNVQSYEEINWLYNPSLGPTGGSNKEGGETGQEYYRRRPKRPESNWLVLDARWLIRLGREAGMDYFTFGISQRRPATTWVNRLLPLLEACATENALHPELPPFRIIPWILSNTSITGAADTSDTAINSGVNYLADDFTALINDPKYGSAFLKEGGKTVFMPYTPNRAPNNAGPATPTTGVEASGHKWWRLFIARMLANGTPAALWMEFQDSITTWAPLFEDISSAIGNFGSRDYAATGSTTSNSYGNARTYIQNTLALRVENGTTPMPWISPISFQGYYRRGSTDGSSTYGYIWESGAFQNLIKSWTVGCLNQGGTGRRIAMYNTLNDFAEGSQLGPTIGQGWGIVDLNKYWLVALKTGSFPAIVRDGLYLIHRRQKYTGVTYTGLQSKFAVLYHDPVTGHTPFNTDTPVQDIVGVVAFLKAAATVTVTTSAGPTSFSGVTGLNTWTVPLANGAISGKITRSSVDVVNFTTPDLVESVRVIQDLLYRVYSNFDDESKYPRPVPKTPN